MSLSAAYLDLLTTIRLWLACSGAIICAWLVYLTYLALTRR